MMSTPFHPTTPYEGDEGDEGPAGTAYKAIDEGVVQRGTSRKKSPGPEGIGPPAICSGPTADLGYPRIIHLMQDFLPCIVETTGSTGRDRGAGRVASIVVTASTGGAPRREPRDTGWRP